MRIAFFHNLPPGGAQRVLYHEIKLLKLKNEVHTYSYKSTDDSFLNINKISDKYFLYNFPQIKFKTAFLTRFINDFLVFVYLPILSRLISIEIDKQNYDVVVVHPDSFTQAPNILRHLKTPTVYYCHELLRICYEPQLEFRENVGFLKEKYERITRKIRKNIDYQNASSADLVLTNSRYIQEKIKSVYKRESIICYPGVDFSFFKEINSLDRKYLLFVGDEMLINGWSLFLKIKRKLIKRGISKNKFKVIKFSKKKKVSDLDLVKIYNQSICVFCLSYNEPFGMVGIEAMASGACAIAINQGGYLENVGKISPRFLISEKINLEEIEKIFEFVKFGKYKLNDSEKKRLNNFSWENHVKILNKAIVNLISK